MRGESAMIREGDGREEKGRRSGGLKRWVRRRMAIFAGGGVEDYRENI